MRKLVPNNNWPSQRTSSFLQNPLAESSEIYNTRILQSLFKHCIFVGVPPNTGIYKNEQADRYAKEAMDSSVESYRIKTPAENLKQYFKTKIIGKKTQYW